MDKNKILVHRANSPINTAQPIDEIRFWVNKGYSNLEIDIHAITFNSFKFSHPLYANKVNEIYKLGSTLCKQLFEEFPNVIWYVDLKYLDLDKLPFNMMDYLATEFNDKAVFTAANKDLLKYFKKRGMIVGQYFKPELDSNIGFEPDLYFDNETELSHPKEKTIVYAKSTVGIQKYLNFGYKAVIADGANLI